MAKRGASYDDWPHYEPSRPRPAEGIRAQHQRGAFGSSWWAKRWITALEQLMDAGRLARGRGYARGGQVLNLDIAPGRVTARVQGSRPAPYKVSVELAPLSDAEWARTIAAMAEQALFAARLLNGEMPENIEEAFAGAGTPLFPTSGRDLVTSCSCPDWANPCKHVAAVYFLLGERFDADPFLLFTLRGRSKAEVIAALRDLRTAATVAETAAPYVTEPALAPDGVPLAEQLANFWTAGPGLAAFPIQVVAPVIDLALLKRLGPPPVEPVAAGSGGYPTAAARLAATYAAVTAAALALAYAEVEPAG
jgi:uncharacterized Zn finger protein